MDNIKGFISAFMSAVSNCTLYSEEHASVDDLAKKAHSVFNELLQEQGVDRLEVMVVEDDLIANKMPVREAGVHGTNLVKRFKRRGLSRVDFLQDIALTEMKQFVADIALPNRQIGPYQHIKSGIIDIKEGGLRAASDFDQEGLAGFTEDQLARVKEIYHSISPFKRLNVAGLEEIVINFILAFKREANILKLISPVKSYSEYTYTHAANVAVLSLFQAENLGMRDDVLHDMGIAALLHDVGKLFIPKDILDKKGSLDESEWEEIREHPLYGARYLANVDDIPRLAAIAAFEHHLGYDGKGYPGMKISGKQQHLCSQVIAISDFFDALRSRRPYKRPLEVREIIVLMKKDAGKAFNPVLLDKFIIAMHKALAE